MTTEVVNDVFSDVSSSTNPNYAENMNSYAPEGSSNSNITIGLVSAKLTNILRKSFNNVYSNTNTEKLIKKMEDSNLLSRTQICLEDFKPICLIIARLIAALIVAILSIDVIKKYISPKTVKKLSGLYNLAMQV